MTIESMCADALRAMHRGRVHPIAAVALATAVVSLIFLAFPSIDVAVAGLFHRPGVSTTTEFPAEEIAWLQSYRRAGMAVTRDAALLLGLAVVAKVFVPLLARAFSTRALLFLVTSLALGPGLLINAVFKETWGRPRPSETTLFGGPWQFHAAWVPGGDCPTNCSFPSGEASGAMWLMALVFVVPPAWRRVTAAVVAVWVVTISVNRMLFGSHFLSDVTIAWGLTALVVLVVREAILVRSPEAGVMRIDAALARIGEWAIDRFRTPQMRAGVAASQAGRAAEVPGDAAPGAGDAGGTEHPEDCGAPRQGA